MSPKPLKAETLEALVERIATSLTEPMSVLDVVIDV